jgi:hypothetical protein
MDPTFYDRNPLRPLDWRAERAMQLASNGRTMKPRRFDDRFVRTYGLCLLNVLEGRGDWEERQPADGDRGAVHRAHLLHFHRERELRDILQARLLTGESFADIATRLGSDPATIEFYGALFFDVRDRLQNRNWIALTALRPDRIANFGSGEAISADERAYLYRWTAYSGGPLALDALIGSIGGGAMPEGAADVRAWFDELLRAKVRAWAVAAAQMYRPDAKDSLRLIRKHLLATIRARKNADGRAASRPGAKAPNVK